MKCFACENNTRLGCYFSPVYLRIPVSEPFSEQFVSRRTHDDEPAADLKSTLFPTKHPACVPARSEAS